MTAVTINSITVSWTRDASDNSGTDTLFVMTSSGANAGSSPVTVTNGSSGSVNNLTVNTPYTITVGSANGRSAAINYTIPAPPTGLMVLSMNSTSIAAKWTRGAGDNGTDTIVAMSGNTVAGTALVSSGSTGVVTGLVDGKPYVISVRNVTGGLTDTITWAPADRTPTSLQIFEKSDPSSSDPSALVLGTGVNAASVTALTGALGADFVLDEYAGAPAGITLETGQLYNVGWNNNGIDGDAYYIPGGLDSNYRSTSYLAEEANAHANEYDIPSDGSYGTTGSRILIVNTGDSHLALIEIVPDASTGQLYSTNAAGYKYLTLNVSYQSTANQPYAARGRSAHSSSTPVKRISAK